MTVAPKYKAIIYLRVSTSDQATEAYGLESQKKACQRLCAERGWEVVRIFEDAGFSAWKKDVERPSFDEMMNFLAKNRDVNLVFFDYSRFARDVQAALNAMSKLRKWGIFYIAADSPLFDCTTASGRTAIRDALNRAEDFSDQHSEKTRLRMRNAFEDGRWCRPAPLGYRTLGKKHRGRSNLVPDEGERAFIVRAFEAVSLGHETAAGVLRRLTAEGLKSKRRNPLSLGAFLDVLRNPVYIGKMASKVWGTVQGHHEAIVDERIFDNVQLVLSGKKPIVAPYRRNREEFPLRGFLRCGVCGNPLTGGPSTSSTGKTYDYYFCHKSGCRRVRSVPTSKAAEQFIDLLSRLNIGQKFTAEFVEVLRSEWKKRTGNSEHLTKQLRSKLEDARQRQKDLVAHYLRRDEAIMPIFGEMSKELRDEITDLENQLRELDAERTTFDQLHRFSEQMLLDIPGAWAAASVAQKQRVQKALFPEGLRYSPEKEISNVDNSCLFSQLEAFLGGKMEMVRPRRFELLTYSFGGCRSIQLSYGRAW